MLIKNLNDFLTHKIENDGFYYLKINKKIKNIKKIPIINSPFIYSFINYKINKEYTIFYYKKFDKSLFKYFKCYGYITDYDFLLNIIIHIIKSLIDITDKNIKIGIINIYNIIIFNKNKIKLFPNLLSQEDLNELIKINNNKNITKEDFFKYNINYLCKIIMCISISSDINCLEDFKKKSNNNNLNFILSKICNYQEIPNINYFRKIINFFDNILNNNKIKLNNDFNKNINSNLNIKNKNPVICIEKAYNNKFINYSENNKINQSNFIDSNNDNNYDFNNSSNIKIKSISRNCSESLIKPISYINKNIQNKNESIFLNKKTNIPIRRNNTVKSTNNNIIIKKSVKIYLLEDYPNKKFIQKIKDLGYFKD